jgi:single-strand DNA-binding protein
MKKIIIIGHLGKDCIIREVSNKKVINFSVAVTEKYTDSRNQQVEKTTWFDCSIWKNSTDSTSLATYLKKGTHVYIEGNIDFGIYKPDQGEPRLNINVKVSEIRLLSSLRTPESAPQNVSETQKPVENKPENDVPPVDDLPF